MSELILATKAELTNIADAVRNKIDSTRKLSIVEIASEINNIKTKPSLQNKTVTPATDTQTITADNGYDGLGNVVVNGDVNLIAENIKSGTSIFGVDGSFEGGGSSGGSDMEDALVARNISEYSNDSATNVGNYAFYSYASLKSIDLPNATTIGNYAFASCSSLITANLPAATIIGSSAFYSCKSLTSVNLPAATTINQSAFYYCQSLKSINLPAATTIGSRAFTSCSSLTLADLPAVTTIGENAFDRCYSLTSVNLPAVTNISRYAFSRCYNLVSLYLTGSIMCNLDVSSIFSSTPIGGYSASAGRYGSIYVRASMLESYKVASNWKYFSSRFAVFEQQV